MHSLREWQTKHKNTNTLIVQASVIDGSDSWQDFPIGMGYKYVLSDKTQIGSHTKTVLCNISDTDGIRRPTGINRKSILDNLAKNSIFNEKFTDDYFTNLLNYKFVISPEGNGIDCHRHYEALIAGCIPIIEKNPLIEEKYKGCPILYTTDYSEINEEYLLQKYDEMIDKEYDFSRLFLSFYTENQIEEIKKCGNYWTEKLVKHKWY
jgi:hypothetical protein